MYLVNWEEDGSESWVKEQDFNTKEIINQYLQNKTPKKRGRKKKLTITHIGHKKYFIHLTNSTYSRVPS